MANFGAGFWVIGWSDDALDSLAKNEVGELVARKEVPRQCSPVGRDDENLFCWGALSMYKHACAVDARGTLTVDVWLQGH